MLCYVANKVFFKWYLKEEELMIKIKYFVHGTTTDNLEKKATWLLSGELSDKGKNKQKH